MKRGRAANPVGAAPTGTDYAYKTATAGFL